MSQQLRTELSSSCPNLTALDTTKKSLPGSPLSRTNSSDDSGIYAGRASLSLSMTKKYSSVGVLSKIWPCNPPTLAEQMNATSIFAGLAEKYQKDNTRLEAENSDLTKQLENKQRIISAQDELIAELQIVNTNLLEENAALQAQNTEILQVANRINNAHSTQLASTTEILDSFDQTLKIFHHAPNHRQVYQALKTQSSSEKNAIQIGSNCFRIGEQVALNKDVSKEGTIISLNPSKNTAWVSFEEGAAYEIPLPELKPTAFV